MIETKILSLSDLLEMDNKINMKGLLKNTEFSYNTYQSKLKPKAELTVKQSQIITNELRKIGLVFVGKD